MNLFFRYSVGTPLAAAVTVGITLTMAGLIATEFKAEEKLESYDFVINSIPEDVPPVLPKTEIEPLKEVEVPPAPPQTGIDITDKVVESPYVPKKIIAEIPKDITLASFTPADTDQQPILRFPPAMPQRADRSGHCDVRFNVSAQGVPYDIETTYCTQSLFERTTLKSVANWKYRPRIQNGQAVVMVGVTNRVVYRLTDERGHLIPE